MRNNLKYSLLSLALMGLLFFLFTGCSQKDRMVQKLQRTLAQEPPYAYKITVYFLSPYFETRVPIPLEDLLSEKYRDEYVAEFKENLGDSYAEMIEAGYEGPLTVIHLSGSETAESIRAIRERLQPETIEPVEASGRTNARVYYLLESSSGEKLLELLVNATPETIYINEIEVKTNEAFYQIIYPCLGDQAELLKQYFDGVSSE